MKTKISYLFLLLMTLTSFAGLEPTKDKAAINIKVTNMEDAPRENEIVIFEGKETKVEVKGTTNAEGDMSVLLPKGDTYLIKVKGIGDAVDYSTVRVPDQEGLMTSSILIKYKPAKSFTLRNVYFASGSAKLLPSSAPALDELADALNNRTDMRIEIQGHTDNVGDDQSNLTLSHSRSESVKTYLIKKGVDASRLEAVGYGETKPVAYNDTAEGRQKNRRTEVRIL